MAASEKVKTFNELFKQRLNRQHVLSLSACAHCGMCNDSCHYFLADGDPKMTPAAKADRIRSVYKGFYDWIGKFVPFWVGARKIQTDGDLEELKDVFFGSCTGCRRCTLNCPFGVDMAAIVGLTRSCLVDVGVAPEGVLTVMKDQWETGNQMAITPEDYIETLEWLEEETQMELDDPDFKVPIDKEGADFVYVINPREIKYAPLSLQAAFKIFHVAGLDWTMGSSGWDNTNFGLFSGKPDLGGHMSNLAYNHAKKLGVKRLVVSECGHGLRSTKWEGPNWGKANPLPFEIISILELMVDLINSGKIILDPHKNTDPVTYHDPCNLSRSGGMTEEPRFCLKRACIDFREMTPNRSDSYCCTGGGGAMSMSEYSKRRLSVSKMKAEQIERTEAASVATACHNCVDGLTDVIKHNDLKYDFGNGKPKLLPVKNVCEYVADAIVIPKELPERKPRVREKVRQGKILVVDDQPDVVTYLEALLQDTGYDVVTAFDGAEGIQTAKDEQPDLITLDVTMPGKSGVSVFNELRSTPGVDKIPVFIVTGDIDFRQLMYQRTVEAPEGFMQKPINEDVFLMTVDRLLETSRHERELTHEPS
uniref:Reductase, iron-sulfur binding subunit containing response regulator receiver n=1 Tax=uncultured sulfate-reducing bacterium TaxID=153939 RepID=Q3IBN9_9BACT|nr:Reductase, iron-sulfur binding subunit containing response regulator receiver [uncultured sulfate-reducing bacterium]